jgi:DNA-binding transcriptional LysR family regulator
VNLRQLEVFLSVVENESFSKGATASFLTQSTVSQHIAALEEELGVVLLDRTRRKVVPTEAGKLLLQRTRRILAAVEDTSRAMARYRGLEEASLTVGASNIPASYMIPFAVSSLIERHPGVSVTVMTGDSSDVVAQLEREEIEIGVVGTQFATQRVSFTSLGHDRIGLIVPASHRWYGRRKVPLKDLAVESFVTRESGSGTRKTVEEALSGAGVDPRALTVRACFGSNEAVKNAVAQGIGIAFVSELSVQKDIKSGDLAVKPVQGLKISRSFFLAYRKGRQFSPPAVAFKEVLKEIFGGTPSDFKSQGRTGIKL